MKPIMKKTLLGMMMAWVLLSASVLPALAERLNWETESVYFKNQFLIVEGSFFNDTPTAVDRIFEFRARVMMQRHGEWRQIATATFNDINIFIRPGESKRHTFRITGVRPRHIEKWKVSIWMEYHFLNRHHGERHRHHRDWD